MASRTPGPDAPPQGPDDPGVPTPGAILLEIPLPYPELNPNFRPRFPAEKHQAIKAYRDEVEVRARNKRILLGLRGPLAAPVGARIVYVVSSNLRRDTDNLLAQLKAGIDGMVRARLLQDDSIQKLKIRELDVVVRKGIRVGWVAIELNPAYQPAGDPSSLAARLSGGE